MVVKERIQHEGIVTNVSDQTLEVLIDSLSACAGCHAKGVCGMADMKRKSITAVRFDATIKAGDKVMVCASMSNAFYSVLIAYVLPSFLIIATIFALEESGCKELVAAASGLTLLGLYFLFLYLFRDKIGKKIKFTVEKIDH